MTVRKVINYRMVMKFIKKDDVNSLILYRAVWPIDPNAFFKRERLLMHAVRYKARKVIAELLIAGASPYAKPWSGHQPTPINEAAHFGDPGIFKLLWEHLNHPTATEDGQRLIEELIMRGNRAKVDPILADNPNLRLSGIHIINSMSPRHASCPTVREIPPEEVAWKLGIIERHDPTFEPKVSLNTETHMSYPPFFYFLRPSVNTRVIEQLIEIGADPNATTALGRNALIQSVINRATEIAAFLIPLTRDLHAKARIYASHPGMNALELAIEHNVPIATALMAAGVQVYDGRIATVIKTSLFKDAFDVTRELLTQPRTLDGELEILQHAIEGSNVKGVAFILEALPHLIHTALPNNNLTSLAYAVAYDSVRSEVLEVLVQHGASLAEQVDERTTVLHRLIGDCVAAQHDRGTGPIPPRFRTLKQLGGAVKYAAAHELDHADENGDTALHRAIASKCDEVVELLIKHGANPLTPNKDGMNAIQLAHKMRLKRYDPLFEQSTQRTLDA